jgi:hypothetical protein
VTNVGGDSGASVQYIDAPKAQDAGFVEFDERLCHGSGEQQAVIVTFCETCAKEVAENVLILLVAFANIALIFGVVVRQNLTKFKKYENVQRRVPATLGLGAGRQQQ